MFPASKPLGPLVSGSSSSSLCILFAASRILLKLRSHWVLFFMPLIGSGSMGDIRAFGPTVTAEWHTFQPYLPDLPFYRLFSPKSTSYSPFAWEHTYTHTQPQMCPPHSHPMLFYHRAWQVRVFCSALDLPSRTHHYSENIYGTSVR